MHPQRPRLYSYYCRNCVEWVWWPWYIVNDIWFQDDFWEACSLGFQISFSKAWYFEEIRASISWNIVSREYCPFWSTVLRCGARVPIHTLKILDWSQRCQFFNWLCVRCYITYRRSVAVFCMRYKIGCNPMHSLKSPFLLVLFSRSLLTLDGLALSRSFIQWYCWYWYASSDIGC